MITFILPSPVMIPFNGTIVSILLVPKKHIQDNVLIIRVIIIRIIIVRRRVSFRVIVVRIVIGRRVSLIISSFYRFLRSQFFIRVGISTFEAISASIFKVISAQLCFVIAIRHFNIKENIFLKLSQ